MTGTASTTSATSVADVATSRETAVTGVSLALAQPTPDVAMTHTIHATEEGEETETTGEAAREVAREDTTTAGAQAAEA